MKLPFNNPASLPFGVITAFASIFIIWGTTYLAIAIAIRTVPAFISGAARFLIAGAVMYAWLRYKHPRPFAGINIPMAALTGALLSGMGNGFVVWAQQGIPSGIAALIVTAVPVTVLVLDWAFFSKRAPTRQALLGTAIALAGVVIVVVDTHSLAGESRLPYLLALIASVVAWSFGTLVQKRAAGRDTVLGFTCVQMLFGGSFQLAMSFADGEWSRFDVAAVTLSSLLAVAYLIVFGSIIALTCYLWLLTRVAAPKVTTYALVNPVVALVLGALILDERITALAMTAAVLVLAGVALVLFQDLNPAALWRGRQKPVAALAEQTRK